MSLPTPDLTVERLLASYRQAVADQLEEGLVKIRHCLDQLDEEQFWWRPSQDMNSVANILLHLAGNLRQWLVAGLSDQPDLRKRQAEFDDRSRRSKAELLSQLQDTIRDASATIGEMSDQEFLRKRRVQEFDLSGFQTIEDSVCHYRGHVQEIIHMTRCLKGADYRFYFVPQNGKD